MAIGTRNNRSVGGDPVGYIPSPAGTPGAYGPLGGPGCGCSDGVTLTWLYPKITAVPTDISGILGAPFTAYVATLDAPNPGQTYVIERALLTVGGSSTISVVLGDLVGQNIVDQAENVTSTALVMADGDSALRVPAGSSLSFVWYSATAPTLARLQVRVEA